MVSFPVRPLLEEVDDLPVHLHVHNDLLGRDTVQPVREDAHEFNVTIGHDESLEATVSPQRQQGRASPLLALRAHGEFLSLLPHPLMTARIISTSSLNEARTLLPAS